MRRFFVDPNNFSGSTAFLTGSEAHHIAAVLRLQVGTRITLFDGSGSFYEALITKISPKKIETSIEAITPYIKTDQEKHRCVHLGQAVIKGKKMDLIIQKATELGVDVISVFKSTYSATKGTPANRFERWAKIAQEACKQCNRPKPPDLSTAGNLNEFLKTTKEKSYDLKLIFWEEEIQTSLQDIFQQHKSIRSVLLLIGPEGGFSPAEAEQAIEYGFQPVTLGRRILRAETAAIAAISIFQHQLENLS
jgi:16S rRNA (uracil1498-N3)-methyltransferase